MINGAQIQDPLVIAEEFNNYFVNIGPNLAQNIPDADLDFRHFLKMRNSHTLFLDPILEHEVLDIVNNLKINKSAGYDRITHFFLLKQIIGEIVSPLTHILNKWYRSQQDENCQSNTNLQERKCSRSCCSRNYRPISLLTSFSKILEKLIYKRTMTFLTDFDILSGTQFGFRKKHSTTHELLKFLDKVAHSIDNKLHTIGTKSIV